MEPLKITFTFSAPVFINSEYPVHMDALIASCVAKEAEEMEHENPWRFADDLSDYLAKTEGLDWVWKASKLVFTQASGIMFQNMIRKSDPYRFFDDLGEFWTGRNPTEEKPNGSINPDTFLINIGSGQMRGYQWLSASQWMEKAEAWVIGDKGGLESCLTRLGHIGKVGRNGYGQIKSMTIESAPHKEAEKWRLRVLPDSEEGFDDVRYELVEACIRAPYWNKLNRVIAKEPLV